MLPDRKQFENILKESEEMNPGPWANHCRVAACCAEKIASRCEGMDTEKAYVLGLMHDIGRRFGINHFKHVSNGYYFMHNLGYDEIARVCLTHSFPTKDINTYIGTFDVSDETLNEFKIKLENIEYDDYDRLIQLCDCLAASEGVVDMTLRMDNVEKRYGFYPKEKREKNLELKKYFEAKTAQNIYRLLSDDKKL